MAKKAAKKKAASVAVATQQKGGALVAAEDLPEAQQGFLVHQFPRGHLVEQVSQLLASPDVDEFSLLRIRVPTGGGTKFVVSSLEGEESVDELRCVVLGNTSARAWWETSFEESGGGTPPSCTSSDLARGFGKLPEAALKAMKWAPQMGTHSGGGFDCATCPMSQWGSDRRGRQGQDCKQLRALFVLLEGEIIPAVVVAPPSSLKSVQQYFMTVARSAVGGPHRFVTSIKLERKPGPPPYSQLSMSAAGKLSDSLIPEQSEFAHTIAAYRSIVQKKFIPAFTIDISDVAAESAGTQG